MLANGWTGIAGTHPLFPFSKGERVLASRISGAGRPRFWETRNAGVSPALGHPYDRTPYFLNQAVIWLQASSAASLR